MAKKVSLKIGPIDSFTVQNYRDKIMQIFTMRCDLKISQIEYRSDDVIKMKFVKLWDLLRYSERTTSKTPTRQKLAIRGKLSLRY